MSKRQLIANYIIFGLSILMLFFILIDNVYWNPSNPPKFLLIVVHALNSIVYGYIIFKHFRNEKKGMTNKPLNTKK